jgi:glycosyltransferase involved in cell wall biosynthesis
MSLMLTLRDLFRRSVSLDHRVRALREELDALRSSLEVPAGLSDEYQAWKAANPLPAEPLVSLCIATYNRSRLLVERSLASALAQDYPRLEVVVVGDGCTDDTEAVMAGVRDPRVRFVNLPERGRYPADPRKRWMVAGTPAANHAMEISRGDLLTHLDDDDEHPPHRVSALVRLVRETGCDFVWHPFHYQTPRYRWTLNPALHFGFEQVSTSSILYRAWFRRIPWSMDAWRTGEPGDWHRLRRIRYLGIDARRHPEPLLRHYRERSQRPEPPAAAPRT